MSHTKRVLSPQKQRFLQIFSKDLKEDRQNGLAVSADEVRRLIQCEERLLFRLTDDEFASHEHEYFFTKAALRDID
ncbi:hypothetical protein EBR66_02920 [bacterium]|nr:hypothetical protein [bacterium]